MKSLLAVFGLTLIVGTAQAGCPKKLNTEANNKASQIELIKQ